MIGHFPIYTSIIKYLPTALTNPVGLVYDATGGRIAVADISGGSGMILFLNSTTFALLHTINVSGRSTSGLGFDPINNRFWVGEDSSVGNPNGRIRVYSGVDYSEITNFFNSAYANYRGFCFDYSIDRVFVSCAGAATLQPISTIEVYKISDYSFVGSFNCDKSIGIEIDVSNRKLYVAGGTSANIRTYNLDTFALVDTITGTGDFALSTVYGITQDPVNSDLMIVQDVTLNKLVLLRKSTNTIIGKSGGVTGARMSIFANGKIYITQSGINKLSEHIIFYQ